MQDGFVKVAAVSPRIRVADVDHNVRTCVGAIRQAAAGGARVVVLPELCLTGATCQDLFFHDALIRAARDGVLEVAAQTADLDLLAVVGTPLRVGAKLFDAAVVLLRGDVFGVVPKQLLAPSEARHFCSGPAATSALRLGDNIVPFGANQLFACEELPDLVVAVEFASELAAPIAPSSLHAYAGATLVASLGALPALAGGPARTRALATSQGTRATCAYALAGAGAGESTTNNAYAGHCLVSERDHVLAESRPFADGVAVSEVDVALIASERARHPLATPPAPDASAPHTLTAFHLGLRATTLTRTVDAAPFIPQDEADRAARCEEILSIQANALAARMRTIGCTQAVVGISGGLDSTLALLVTARAFDLLQLDRANICAITMPGFGTTDRTHNNAWQLALSLGATPREIPIGASVRQHFADIGHDESVRNAAYENAQARERTQILMDVANDNGGIVVGTGDLSELALGWATYNGDHMSMYAVNAAVPKTLIRHIVGHVAATCGDAREAEVLRDVVNTPVSPELLPANDDGTIAQQTEDLVGPYELHDFFAYYLLRHGFGPRKICRLALAAFAGVYDKPTIVSWLRVFCRRFFSQQFKRSCAPDGPAVGSVGLSPRGELAMPSDASSALWLAELQDL